MASRNNSILNRIDWLTVSLYIACVVIGWLNIYAAVYNPEQPISIFNFDTNSGKQLVWMGLSVLLIIAILVIDYRFWETFGFFIYGFVIFLLVAVLFLGADIKGSHSWFKIGPVGFQPAEVAKMATILAIAKYLSTPGTNMARFKDQLNVAIFILIPMVLIRVSSETGQALVLVGLMLMLYREGLPGIFPSIVIVAATLLILSQTVDTLKIAIGLAVVAGIVIFFLPRYQRTRRTFVAVGLVYAGCVGMVLAADFFINDVLEPHQRSRIEVLIDPNSHKRGAGWNVIQSKIAIGSGGIFGKGFLQGTQTKFDFVPEQSTDFIFCTVGEEHGFFGSLVVIGLLLSLILRLVFLAERQRTRFARIYGYGVVSVFFFHFLVNIGMTIGLMPVIGIPLPFFSYGGSGLWSFTILLFIFLKLDAQRSFIMSRV
ncbi:rod shape-determining protein RodA [Siphonobacter aquaeclarae]|uniref:Rod shape determining protein RodA n=1 Tax=Siphonobacter aquaeclarae TaxID=563176 RepID=A0A1G9KZU6_9BACT|nr:rod shape-determining protein RodA [Siphonobacter aquaeclarae]SDL55033.1 rod shape determining protein RodA [Siphonobacter aquaeclarae]